MIDVIFWQKEGVVQTDVGAGEGTQPLLRELECLQLPVRRPEMLETTSLGAAYAAGIGIGFWDTKWVLHHAESEHHDSATFHPSTEADSVERRYGSWQKAVQRSYGLADLGDV